jgi:hypothetical protein
MKIAELYTEITAKDGGFRKSMSMVEKKAKRVSMALDKVSETAKRMLVLQGVGAGIMLKIASDYEEAGAKFSAVFKEEAAEAEKFANILSSKVGRSAEDVRKSMSSLQDTFVPLGFARKEARLMSQQMTQLAIDVASFNNAAEEDTMRDFQSAIVGNHETVRKYGIIITQAALDQELMNMGFSDGAKKATELQKVQARLNIIMNGTTDAQGDAEKTAGSLANQWRAMIGQLKDLAAALGNIFVPAAKDAVSAIKDMVDLARQFAKANPVMTKYGLIMTAAATATTLLVAKLPALIAGFKILTLWGGKALIVIKGITLAGALIAAKFIALTAAVSATVLAVKDLITGSNHLSDIWWGLKNVMGDKEESNLMKVWEEQLESGKISADEFLDRIHALKKLQGGNKKEESLIDFDGAKEFAKQMERIRSQNYQIEGLTESKRVYNDRYITYKEIRDLRLKAAKELLKISTKEDEERSKIYKAARLDRDQEAQVARESYSQAIQREQAKKRSLEQELRKASEIKKASLVSTSDISRQVQVAVAGKRDNEQVALLNKQIKNQTSIIEVLKKQLDAILNPEPILSE